MTRAAQGHGADAGVLVGGGNGGSVELAAGDQVGDEYLGRGVAGVGGP